MRPEPYGAGSLSPTPGLRTRGTRCNAVYPGPAAFGSAPASSSAAATSQWALVTATISAVVPTAERCAGAVRALLADHLVDGAVDVDAGCEQRPHDTQVTLAGGEQERREPGIERRTEVRPHLDQRSSTTST